MYSVQEGQEDESKTAECLEIVIDKFKDSDKDKNGYDFLNARKELARLIEEHNLVYAIDTKLDLRDEV